MSASIYEVARYGTNNAENFHLLKSSVLRVTNVSPSVDAHAACIASGNFTRKDLRSAAAVFAVV